MYTLFYAQGSASMGVRVLLEEIDAPYKLIETSIDRSVPCQPEHLAINPNGWIPALSWAGGAMYECAAITVFLCDRYPEAQLAPAIDEPTRATFLQTLVYFSNSIQNAYQLTYYPDRFADTPADAPSAERRGCRRLREKPDLSQVPLLVLTSTRNSVSDEEIQEVGAVANIEKPFKPIVFTDEVERIIGPGHIASTPEPEAQAGPDPPETGMAESPPASGDATGESEETPSTTAAEETPEQMEAAPAEAEGAESRNDEEQIPSSDAPLALDSETLAPIIGKHLEEAVEKIAPTLLSHIEEVVVKQLPYIVEKIVIREIEKIKRGE